jgi:acetyltransferase-like isoleucine patch superfamily enzyme
LQDGPMKEIAIGSDVWLGCHVVVLKGVCIGDGAVVGAGAILTKSVPPGEIWAGIPASKIGTRS